MIKFSIDRKKLMNKQCIGLSLKTFSFMLCCLMIFIGVPGISWAAGQNFYVSAPNGEQWAEVTIEVGKTYNVWFSGDSEFVNQAKGNRTWTTSDDGIVSVTSSRGTMTGVAVGKAKITVTCNTDSTISATLPVNVVTAGTSGVTSEDSFYIGGNSITGCETALSAFSLHVGDGFTLPYTISNLYLQDAPIMTSSAPAVAAIHPTTGYIQALSPGTTVITLSAMDAAGTVHSASVPVTVLPISNVDFGETVSDVYLEATVFINGIAQRIRVYDPSGVLPAGTYLVAKTVNEHENLDDTHEIEHVFYYDLTLFAKNGTPLSMPLKNSVDLYFEVVNGMDAHELEAVLVRQFEDAEFDENTVNKDGRTWRVIKTNHFSPYVLIDKLSKEEKLQARKENIKSGDVVTNVTIASLGMVLVLALGVMLPLLKKKKFEI